MNRLDDDTWKLTFKLLPALDDMKLVHIVDVTHYYPPHVHEEFCVAIILRGEETHIVRDREHTAGSGDLLLINAEEAHASRSLNVEYKTIQINPISFERLFQIHRPHFAEPIVRDAELHHAFLDLYSKLEQDLPLIEQEFELVSKVGRLLESRAVFNTPAEPRAIKTVRDYLRIHFSETVSLSDLASIAELSPFHLVRVFGSRVGVPPHEYQTQIRITHAQRLLRDGCSISQAAVETGFFDQSHFSRNFKRITGLTPGNYVSHSNIVQDG